MHLNVGATGNPMGARSVAMGNASVTISDVWAGFTNIAGLATIEKSNIGLAYQNLFGISELNHVAATYCMNTKYGVPSVHFLRVGSKLLNQQWVAVGYAHKIHKVSLGLKVNYAQLSAEELNTKRNIVLEFGGIAEITKELFFGAHACNLTQSKWGEEDIPTILKAGFSFRPNKKVMFNAETEKDVLMSPAFKAGIEYAIIEKLKLRTGISTNPFMAFGGWGVESKNLRLDYSAGFHMLLGMSHQINISWCFAKKPKQ
ncbi:MAG: hypothetical protein NZ529_03020 [Cytophagaceae bacterium]|nr:hypothetical protein [Cytophagaceae bacterium]MDW8455742.1 hypothetical protein [Cytophagaceae bacterium]